jgi:ribosomal protein S18 acetylase RimI-like enzyme
MSREIRRAVPADRSFVESIVQAAYAHYVPRIGREPAPMTDDYAGRIERGEVHVLENNGVIQGLVVLIPETGAMLLDNIAVAPACRGQGLGRIPLDFAERTAREAGYGVIRLYTNAAMTENIALYIRTGYAETHRDGEKGFRRVYMEKRLS